MSGSALSCSKQNPVEGFLLSHPAGGAQQKVLKDPHLMSNGSSPRPLHTRLSTRVPPLLTSGPQRGEVRRGCTQERGMGQGAGR